MRISTIKKNLKKYFLIIPLVLVVILLVYYQVNKNISGDEVIKRVGELYVLPENEIPTILEVSDIELLKDKPFFNKAEVGFKVLVYAISGKAILYDVKNNKVVEVGNINSVLK